MKTTIFSKGLKSFNFQTVVNEAARIIENEPQTFAQDTPVSECFGVLGTMSPMSRPAFVEMFGEELTAEIEAAARQMLADKEARKNASHYAQHMAEAKNAEGVPAAGDFIICTNSGIKCDGGKGVFEEIRNLCELSHDGEDIRAKRLCQVSEVITVTPDDFNRPELADELTKAHNLQGFSRSEDVDDSKLSHEYTQEDWDTFYTVGAVVTDGVRWFLIDSEGYGYARYIYMPYMLKGLYNKEIDQEMQQIRNREEMEARQQAEEKAARLADYEARCNKWTHLMQPVQELTAQEYEAYKSAYTVPRKERKNSPEYKAYRSISAKLSAARRANILAMCRAAFPGVKFSCALSYGSSHDYTVQWTDGPTEAEFNSATDLALFTEVFVTFDGYTDSHNYNPAEFGTFAAKYMDSRYTQINTQRDYSAEALEVIGQAVAEALPEMTEEQKHDSQLLTSEQVCQVIDHLRANDPQVSDIQRGSEYLNTVIFRIWRVTGFCAQPSKPEKPTEQPKDQPADRITSFEQIDTLYKNGTNICEGCPFRNCAACTPDRFDTCTEQLHKHTTATLSGVPKLWRWEFSTSTGSRYTVWSHDGQKTYNDGSPLFDPHFFNNKRDRDQYINELKSAGYVWGFVRYNGSEREIVTNYSREAAHEAARATA